MYLVALFLRGLIRSSVLLCLTSHDVDILQPQQMRHYLTKLNQHRGAQEALKISLFLHGTCAAREKYHVAA